MKMTPNCAVSMVDNVEMVIRVAINLSFLTQQKINLIGTKKHLDMIQKYLR